ncbi:MAG: porin [Pseudomonadota bacterium]
MKKILFASTALAAAGLMAGPAAASEKIKLELGGFSKWWVVGQWNESSLQRATPSDYNNVDVKGDNEVFFGGSTKLDNGMTVGVQIELEAGGDTATDRIEKSYIFAETGFGKFIVGSEANGTALLHVMAPDAAGNIDADGIITGGFAINRANGSTIVTTAIDTDGEAEGITYVAPTFYGLTVGGSYKANADEDNRGLSDLDSNVSEVFGVGALYANTFGAVDFKLSAGWATYDANGGGATATPTGDSTVNEYALGTQIGYAGFTLGGSYRDRDGYKQTTTALQETMDAKAWDAGIQYASGPYAVSFFYLHTEEPGSVTVAGEDTSDIYQVSGKYALGPGVDVLATVGYAKYDDETQKTTATENVHNKGWAVMTGMALTF